MNDDTMKFQKALTYMNHYRIYNTMKRFPSLQFHSTKHQITGQWEMKSTLPEEIYKTVNDHR